MSKNIKIPSASELHAITTENRDEIYISFLKSVIECMYDRAKDGYDYDEFMLMKKDYFDAGSIVNRLKQDILKPVHANELFYLFEVKETSESYTITIKW